MCYTKYGNAVASKEDIRNLITGVILRQRNPYKKEHILETVLMYLEDAATEVEDSDVSRLIDNGLDILGRNGEVSCWNGMYRTATID